MPEVVCPMPKALDYKTAKATYAQVRKDTNYKLSPAANRREAARRLSVDEDTFTNVLQGKKALTPSPVAPKPKPLVMPEMPKPTSVPTPTALAPQQSPQAYVWDDMIDAADNYKGEVTTVLDRMADRIGYDAVRGGKHSDFRVYVQPKKNMPKGSVGYQSGSSVNFSTELFSAKFTAEAQRMWRSRFWAKPQNLNSAGQTLSHEVGHALMERVNPSVFADALKGFADDIGSAPMLGNEHVVANWMKKNSVALKNKVSGYAVKDADPHELYAEMWAMYIDNPTDMPNSVRHFGDTIAAQLRKQAAL